MGRSEVGELVENKVGEKTATFKDSFVGISSSSFRLVSEGREDCRARDYQI